MKIPTIKEIKEYYPTYLSVHQNKMNRRLHFIGQCLTLSYLAFCLFFGHWLMLLLTPFLIYPFAWYGHLHYEKNEPATWTVNPLITKACDWVMFKDIVLGRLSI